MATGPGAPNNPPKPPINIPGASGPTPGPPYGGFTYVPSGPSGFTGVAYIPVTEPLFHSLPTPWGGSLECVKQDLKYGIVYKDPQGDLSDFIAVFDGQSYQFPRDFEKTWMGNVPLSSAIHKYQTITSITSNRTPSGADALLINAAYQSVLGTRDCMKDTINLYNKHVSSSVWQDFLDDAEKTFIVAAVMTC